MPALLEGLQTSDQLQTYVFGREWCSVTGHAATSAAAVTGRDSVLRLKQLVSVCDSAQQPHATASSTAPDLTGLTLMSASMPHSYRPRACLRPRES